MYDVTNKLSYINRKITFNTINISAKTNNNVESLFETIDELFR